MPEEPSKRRRSASEGFRPIKQVGVANSIGFPLMMIGILILFIANSAGGTGIWVLGGVLVALGLVASLSGKVI